MISQDSLIIGLIIVLVLIVFPAILAKKSGKNPMELIFGRRVNDTLFVKKTDEGTGPSAAGGGEGKKTKSGAAAGDKGKGNASGQKNSNKNELLDLISTLVSFARRNHFRIIVPASIRIGDETAMFVAVLITRSRVAGINCYGYGGTVHSAPGEDDWEQTINGEKKKFPSPVRINRERYLILEKVLKESGYGEAPREVIGVFTAPSVHFLGGSRGGCYTKQSMLDYLRTDRFMRDGGLDPDKIMTALDPYVERTGDAKEDKRKKADKR